MLPQMVVEPDGSIQRMMCQPILLKKLLGSGFGLGRDAGVVEDSAAKTGW